MLERTAGFGNLRRHCDHKRRTYRSSTTVLLLQQNCIIETPIGCLPQRTSVPLERDESLNRNPLLQ